MSPYHLVGSTLLLLLLSLGSIQPTNSVVVLTSHFCNFTRFPQTGCEDKEGSECIENKCQCKPDKSHLVLGRFCFEKSCDVGYFYDRFQQKCLKQRRASAKPEESHCRYDYHCFGSNVHCVQYGWNFNCICEPGFVYEEFSGLCKPMYGIGGHCKTDSDCDSTSLRKMACLVEDEAIGGTCQCLAEHRYNHNIDGCEPITDILEREHQMRMLIVIFIIGGLVFGLSLTCNFGWFSTAPKPRELLLKRLQQEAERIQRQNSSSAAPAPPASSPPVPSEPPPVEEEKNPESVESTQPLSSESRQPQSLKPTNGITRKKSDLIKLI